MSCCCGACPCCLGWPSTSSGGIVWTAVSDASDCGASAEDGSSQDFGCTGSPEDEIGTLIFSAYTDLYVRVFCDFATGIWKVQYRSGTTGPGDCEVPAADEWIDVVYDFVCPDCEDAIDGVAYGTIDFIAVMCCEISGPTIVTFNVTVHADIEIPCT